MAQRSERRIPRAALVLVGLVALGTSLALVRLAWRASKKSLAPAPAAGPTGTLAAADSSFVACTSCHKDLDKVFREGRVPGLLYTHEKHFAKGVSDCAMCHPPNTHEPDKVNKPTMSRCFMCHGLTETAIAPGRCQLCHPPGFPSKPASHQAANWVRPAHGKTALEDPFQCRTCHEEKFCNSCHGGLAMPHPEGWKELPHARAFFDAGADACSRCHARGGKAQDFCDTCHHPQGPKDVAWRAFHPNVVKSEGAKKCFSCHDPVTCATCHVRNQESFEADRGLLPSPSPEQTSPTPAPTP